VEQGGLVVEQNQTRGLVVEIKARKQEFDAALQ
jgi:hypothetical protein